MKLFELAKRSVWNLSQFNASRAAPERVREAQERRLRRLLALAAERSPFYRAKYRGIDLARCGLDELPTTNKAELMAHFDEVVTDRAVTRAGLEAFVDDPANVGKLFLGKYPACHTSGSQGQTMFVVQDRLVLDLLFAFQMTRGNVDYGPWHTEAARRIVSPGRVAAVVSKPGFYPSTAVWRHLPESFQPFARLLAAHASEPDLADKLNAFQPTAVTSSPTTLDLLAAGGGLRLRKLRQVVTWSEVLTDAARARLEAAFGVPVLDTYGMGECIFLTSGCAAGPGAHVNADWAVLEVVDGRDRPVPAGRLGQKVLVTNLANSVLPLIRYEVGDQVEMAAQPCRCGNRLPRVARVVGRAADVFWLRSGAGYRALRGEPFQHAFEHQRGVREWQATQIDRRRVRVRVEMLPGASLDAAAVRRRLDAELAEAGFGGEVDVRLEAVPRLGPDERTGKFRRLIALGPPAGGAAHRGDFARAEAVTA